MKNAPTITFDSPGNNDRAIVRYDRADGTPIDIHFDVTLGIARVRYADDTGEIILFPADEIVAPAVDALAAILPVETRAEMATVPR